MAKIGVMLPATLLMGQETFIGLIETKKIILKCSVHYLSRDLQEKFAFGSKQEKSKNPVESLVKKHKL